MKRDLIIVVIGRILQMAVLLATLRIMTTRLNPSEVGNFSLLTSYSTLFVWILISPVGLYINRHTLDWQTAGTIWANYGRYGLYILAAALFTAAVLWGWKTLAAPAWVHQFRYLEWSLALYIIFSVSNQTVIPSLNLLGRRLSYTLCFLASQIFALGSSWFFTTRLASGEVWFFGQTAGFAMGFLLALPFFAIASPPTIASAPLDLRAGLNDVATFCLPIAITAGLTWLQFQSYRIILSHSVSLSFLGLFFAGYTASAGIMGAIEITAGQFFAPYFYKHMQDTSPAGRHDAWAAYMATLYPMIAVAVLMIAALSQPITHILLNPKFWAGSAYVSVGAVVEGVRVMTATYGLATHVSKRTSALLLPNTMGALAIVVTLIGGTWLFGEKAVGPAMILSALVFLVTMHRAMTRTSGGAFPLYGKRWVISAAAVLAILELVRFFIPAGNLADIAVLCAGAILTVSAFLLIFRDAQPALSRFAK